MKEAENRILYVHGNIMNNAGTESYMMNYYRNMDRNKFQIDFIVHGYEKGFYDDEIERLGGKIYHVPIKTKHPIRNYIEIYRICKSGKYKMIHSHMDAMSYIPLKIAKKAGIPIRIAHSHNTQFLTTNSLKIKMNEFAKKRLLNEATHLFACSSEAGKWLYGEKKLDIVQVIPNAIDTDKFLFDNEKRKEIRKKLHIEKDDIVIGHVGRFEYQKNHGYLIKIIHRLNQRNSRYKLMLFGEGSLRKNIERMIKERDLENVVYLLGNQSNINEYLNVFDLFCFPSHFEGLGIVLIEAQVNGLKCLASEKVPREVNLTGNVEFLPILESSKDIWIKKIENINLARDMMAIERVKKGGYSIKDAALLLQDKYERLIGEI